MPSDVDSLILTLRYANGSFIGDSVAPMGVNVYALTKQLPSGIASDFDPEGYYNPSKPLASIIYNATSLGSDSIAKLTYRDIRLKLPRELGRELFQKFVDNPSSYANGKTFANEVFPGIYIRNSFGAGRLTMVSQTFMSMHLRHIEMNETTEKLDTTDAVQVLNNNNLSINLASTLTEKVKEGKSLLVAPAGYEVEFDFPTREMVAAFRSHKDGVAVVNGVSMNLPVDTIQNDFKVSPPPYALMVLKKDRDAFFAENKLPDGKTSFYAAYDASNNRYHFGALRSYILEMLDKEEITDEDCNFCLVPVQVNFENLADSGYGGTQQTESEVLPYLISPAMCELRSLESDDFEEFFIYYILSFAIDIVGVGLACLFGCCYICGKLKIDVTMPLPRLVELIIFVVVSWIMVKTMLAICKEINSVSDDPFADIEKIVITIEDKTQQKKDSRQAGIKSGMPADSPDLEPKSKPRTSASARRAMEWGIEED